MRSYVVAFALAALLLACRIPTQRDFLIGMSATQAVAGVSIATYAVVNDEDGGANVQLGLGGAGLIATAALSLVLVYLLPPPTPEKGLRKGSRAN